VSGDDSLQTQKVDRDMNDVAVLSEDITDEEEEDMDLSELLFLVVNTMTLEQIEAGPQDLREETASTFADSVHAQKFACAVAMRVVEELERIGVLAE